MTPLEALVWVVGILTAGGTISKVASSFQKARYTTYDVRDMLEKEHWRNIERQMKEEENETENAAEGS